MATKLKRKSTDFFIFTEFVEVEQCEIKDVKERKPDPESDLQLELQHPLDLRRRCSGICKSLGQDISIFMKSLGQDFSTFMKSLDQDISKYLQSHDQDILRYLKSYDQDILRYLKSHDRDISK